MPAKPDVYTRVTDKIIADLERGNLTWQQPWQAGHQAGRVSRPLRADGKPYRGVNVLMLWASAIEKGYAPPDLDDLQAGRRAGRRRCARARRARWSSTPPRSPRPTPTTSGEAVEKESLS